MIEPYYKTSLGKLYCGDVMKVLKQMPDKLVDCVITSPPYWALRDYGTEPTIWDDDDNCEHNWNIKKRKLHGGNTKSAIPEKSGQETDWEVNNGFCSKCGAWKGELGLEPTFELYIKHLCDIFDEVKRVLKDTGTIWINLGDTYAGGIAGQGGNCGRHESKEGNKYSKSTRFDDGIKKTGVQDKSLCCIPERFMIEMINRGWILRNKIVWFKKNCMPSSVKDRFTVDWEPVLFFSKQKKYYFEQQFEPIDIESIKRERRGNFDNKYSESQHLPDGVHPNTMSQPRKYKGYNNIEEELQSRRGRNKRAVWQINTQPFSKAHFAVFPEKLVLTPIKAGCPKDGIVMDIFSGSGTVAVLAEKLQRKWIGIDLNKEYCEMAKQRIQVESNQIKCEF